MIVEGAIRKFSMFWLVSVAEQAGLSLTWSKTLKSGFLVSQPKLSAQAMNALVIHVPCVCICSSELSVLISTVRNKISHELPDKKKGNISPNLVATELPLILM